MLTRLKIKDKVIRSDQIRLFCESLSFTNTNMSKNKVYPITPQTPIYERLSEWEAAGDHQFSGGMRQRVVIALALCANPELVIADEPTTALDVTIQAQVLEVLAEIRKETGAAMILITHDLGVVAGAADRMQVMYGGRIFERGTTNDVFAQPENPYTQGLLQSMPRLDHAGERLHPILGTPPSLLNMPSGCAFAPRCQFSIDVCHEAPATMEVVRAGHQNRCHLNGEIADLVTDTVAS